MAENGGEMNQKKDIGRYTKEVVLILGLFGIASILVLILYTEALVGIFAMLMTILILMTVNFAGKLDGVKNESS